MPVARRVFLATAAATAAAACLPPVRPRFSVVRDGFRLDGEPFVLRSGSMHYPRVPRPYWRDRMRKLRALGLNTLCTYVFWNAHEPHPGAFDFADNLDLAAYLRTAQEEGLFVILRPGPYVCSEWDFGGLPSWLLGPQAPAARVRTSDPNFLRPVAGYFRRLAREVTPMLVERGGPILLTQVENEYGSFGSDHLYMGSIRDLLRSSGFTGALYTSDGPSPRLLQAGTLPDLPCAINFGDDDDPQAAFAALGRFRPAGPHMCGEFWDGWFDHWGEAHHVTPAARAAAALDWMLGRDISVNLYMAHGGTSFGFMAGANYGPGYEPDTSSYDYDAPLDEAGRPTPKFRALWAAIVPHLAPGQSLPELPQPLPTMTIASFALAEYAPLTQLYHDPRHSPDPLPMEALGQSFGLVCYRALVPKTLAGEVATLAIPSLRDYARVYQSGRELGTLDRSRQQTSLNLNLRPGLPLDIVVESMGRINFGSRLQDNLQGIAGPVLLDGAPLSGWRIFSLPLDDLHSLVFSSEPLSGPGFYRAHLKLTSPGDCFLDLRGWNKGYVWVNGHNLGRFWDRGPQRGVYLPGCWLRSAAGADNEIVVFDWTGDSRPRLLSAAPTGPA